jgi:RNA polymerase sigma factor (sigma-70 family)
MDESDLVSAAQTGSADAFNELVLAYQQQVFNLAYRILGDLAAAGDVTQEAFIAAHRTIGRFRGGSFRAYVLRIVSNRCYDELRRRRRRPTTSFDDLGDVDGEANPFLADDDDGPEERAERHEVAELIQRCIGRLPADQRITLVLSDVQGLAYQEIVEVMGVSLGTVKSRLARARAKVRDYLRESEELLPLKYRLDS